MANRPAGQCRRAQHPRAQLHVMVGPMEHQSMRAWLAALLIGCLASGAAMLLQNLLRGVWQIRGLPERVEEWLLLFVPLDVFEQGLARFGADAKVLALTGTVIGMAVVLAVIGSVVIRAGWRSWALLGLGGVLWLLTMLVVMPV